MKKIFFISAALFWVITTLGQTNFQWEKTDSVALNKNEIYSLTKMFIGEKWKSAQNVIQNDDKESGIILVKGASVQETSFMGGKYIYVYKYSITFRMKNNKYKMTLDNVYCESANMSGGPEVTKIQPFDGDNCPETGTFKAPGLPKKKAIIMMGEFKRELQMLVDSYPVYLKKEASNDDW